MIRVGLISDTHGLLRAEALAFLQGSDLIVHAGDIGSAAILADLAKVAPLASVRGNNDHGPWAETIPATEMIKVGGIYLYVIHDLMQLDIDPRAAGVRVVVAGHSHRPSVREDDGVLFVNPGSAGPRRFRLPVAVGEIRIDGHQVAARTIELLAPVAVFT
ncbi:MAG TPA: metallophosphoesterase [Xanthomonadaceae bacterium]|jgi:putative phosphoesterase|nr:metallophosphoesterase [Xanthomonadaceae bacterium]